MDLDRNLLEVLSALNAHHAKYLVIGGYAFSTHAEVRGTKDLDIRIAVSKENSEAVFRLHRLVRRYRVARRKISGTGNPSTWRGDRRIVLTSCRALTL